MITETANHSIQRTGASRSVCAAYGAQWRLSVCDGCVYPGAPLSSGVRPAASVAGRSAAMTTLL